MNEPAVTATVAPRDGHVDDGERRDAAEAAKSQDAGAGPSKTDAAAIASPSDAPGIEEVGRWLRESVEVTASIDVPSIAAAVPNDAERDVLLDAAVEGQLHTIGAESVIAGSALIQALEIAVDSRPGPKQEVRVVQRSLVAPVQGSESASRASARPAIAPTVK